MQTLQITTGGNVGVKLSELPEHRRDTLTRSTLHAVERFFAVPGVLEGYEKWLKEYERRKLK